MIENEDKAKTRAWVEKEEKERAYFSRLCDTPEGIYVICKLLDRCGNFKTDSSQIKPELVALGSWLLYMCGINNPYNFGAMVEAMAKTNTTEDLLIIKKSLTNKEE